MTEWLYSDVVKEHFTNPKNVLEGDESSWPADGRESWGT
jgi:nitrogen fixation NifU-like protein